MSNFRILILAFLVVVLAVLGRCRGVRMGCMRVRMVLMGVQAGDIWVRVWGGLEVLAGPERGAAMAIPALLPQVIPMAAACAWFR